MGRPLFWVVWGGGMRVAREVGEGIGVLVVELAC